MVASSEDPILRPDLERWVQGKGEYLDDIRLPNLCHVAFARSPHAHARIVSIDASPAMRVPGAIDVVTPDDLSQFARAGNGGFEVGPAYGDSEVWGGLYDRPPLPIGVTLYAGEAIVACVAETRYAAEDMAAEVVIDYEALPPIVDMEEALLPETPVIHEQLGINVFFRRRFKAGDPDRAFAEADTVLERTFRWARQTVVPLEARGAIGSYDERAGRFTAWVSVQGPHPVRSTIAGAFGLDEGAVRVICSDVGGGFGAKGAGSETVLVCHLARRIGRPVKWMEDRIENLLCVQSRDHLIRVSAAFKKDGKLLAMRARALVDAGAHSPAPAGVSTEPSMSVLSMPGTYHLDNFQFDTTAVVTHKAPYVAYRGVSKPVGPFLTERMMDIAAGALGMDPAEIRRRNYIQPDEFPYKQVQGWLYDSGDYPGTMDLALKLADYPALRHEQAEARERGEYIGIGMAAFLEAGSIGSRWYRERGVVGRPAFDGATIQVDGRGRVALKISGKSAGQGHETTFPRLVAKELGLPQSHVRLIQGDTDTAPFGVTAGNSRSAASIGTAILKALSDLKDKMRRVANLFLEVDLDDVELEGGEFFVKADPSRRVSFRDVAAAAYNRSRAVFLDGTGIEPGLEFTRSNDPPQTFANGFHVAVVRVDIETGAVKLDRYFMVDDSGTMLDEAAVKGQALGSTVCGFGNALLEELRHDNGQLITGTLLDYLLPTTDTMPKIEHVQTETPSLLSGNGAKAAGESGNCGAPAAIANAVADALRPFGVEANELPLTPNRVYGLIQAAKRSAG